MKIVFEPNQSKTNAYVNIIKDTLEREGVESYSVRSVFKNWSRFVSIQVVHLNWFENVGSISEFIKKFTKLAIFIISGKKLVWTFHNKQPHNQAYQSLNRFLMYCLARFSNYIIIHSKVSEDLLVEYYGESVRSRIQYIPHPHYINVYGTPLPEVPQRESSPLSLLFLGAVKPYKNIEILINAVKSFGKDAVNLTIMGKPSNVGYEASIRKKAEESNNIHLNLHFVEDANLNSVLNAYDVLVLPYNMESSLNSGSVILAFSYKRTVICPAIGTVTDFCDLENIVVYDYDTPVSHLENLKDAINRAILQKKENPNTFILKGEIMYEKVKTGNDPEQVGKLLAMLYRN
jgi:beta-1,4-mannosyltransferase